MGTAGRGADPAAPEEPPASQVQTHGRLASPELAGQRLAGMPLTETVASALHAAYAEARRRGRPVDTKTLLVALMDADPAGEWDRIWLDSRSREAIGQAGYQDPQEPGCQRDNVALTGACDRAFQRAWQLSQRLPGNPASVGLLGPGTHRRHVERRLPCAEHQRSRPASAHGRTRPARPDRHQPARLAPRLVSSRLNRQPDRRQAHRGNPRLI